MSAGILQDTELNALQDSDALREKYAIRSQFREGAVANLTPAISGGNVVLSLEDNTIATALIMVNGAWEPIAPQTIALPAPKTSGSDTIYLHWALWRVTSDGHYNTSTTCLVDGALTDAGTGERVGERGQLI